MTDHRDPAEIYREALEQIAPAPEDRPPHIVRAEVWPYPDLKRLWVRLQTSPFASYPDIALTARDPEGCIVATMYIVEVRETYQSFTLHLRQPPRPGEQYHLEIELCRDVPDPAQNSAGSSTNLSGLRDRGTSVLDTRTISFELTFKEPEATGHE